MPCEVLQALPGLVSLVTRPGGRGRGQGPLPSALGRRDRVHPHGCLLSLRRPVPRYLPGSDDLRATERGPGDFRVCTCLPGGCGRAGDVPGAAPASPGAAWAPRPPRPRDPRRGSPAPLSRPQAHVGRPDPARSGMGAGGRVAGPKRRASRSPGPALGACARRREAPGRRRAGTPVVTSRRRAGRGRGPRSDRVPSGP